MTDIDFSKLERDILARKVKEYVAKELDQDISALDAEFLLDFFSKEIGPYFYNRGLYDAQTILTKRLDDIGETILDLEKPTDFDR